MDLESHELPLGYDKSLRREDDVEEADNKRRLLTEDLPFEVDPIESLPASVDWRFAATPVKDQGRCGSCWAFASIAALESHLFIQSGLLFSLSEQELVSCAPNHRDCGGEGGCAGATAVQAYNHIHKRGIVQEWKFGYQSYNGDKINCTLSPPNSNSSYVEGAIATIDDFLILPENNYTVMMNAIAKVGPVVISVAAAEWHLYQRGVFRRNFTHARDSDIDHAVVLMGYGTDIETGEDYWLVRNSWSPLWGEQGYIRLFRQDPADEQHCAMDVTPAHGDACKYDRHGNPAPMPAQRVCGTSGVYYLGYVPLGVRLV
jgi:cathepsin L